MPITILFERTCIVVFVYKLFKSLTITCKQTFQFRHFDLNIYLLFKFQLDINDIYIIGGVKRICGIFVSIGNLGYSNYVVDEYHTFDKNS